MSQEFAELLLGDYQETLYGGKIVIDNLDPRKPSDMSIVLRVVLRNFTEKQFISLVDGITEVALSERDPSVRTGLYYLREEVRIIGEENLSINWNNGFQH